jgi:SAM-dependent methyltransferase
MSTPGSDYVLGSSKREIRRLDAQAALYERASETLLRTAGIGEGQRVLDLGSGLGHVARLVAALVGPSGEVVGVDRDEKMLELARERTAAAGLANIRFVSADVHEFRDPAPFDAVVCRLLLFHLPEPVQVLRHHAGALREGGSLVALDFDVGVVRSEPPVPLVETAARFVLTSFLAAGTNPLVGARLVPLLREAGLHDVGSLGLQSYFAPDDPHGPPFVAGVVRAMAAVNSPPPEIDPETIEERIADALRDADAVFLPPTLVGAWGQR